MSRWSSFLALCWAGCALLEPATRPANRCLSYEAFVGHSPKASAAERAQCAKLTLSVLADSMTTASAFRREVRAMAQDFRREEVEAWVADAFGPRFDELRAELAIVFAQAERVAAVDACASLEPLQGLECLQHEPPAGRTARADAHLLRGLEAAKSVESVEALLRRGEALSSASVRERAVGKLEALCDTRWPVVEALGRSLAAASQAAPCASSPRHGSKVRTLVSEAKTAEEAHAAQLERRGLNAAAWLHRSLVARLAGQPAPAPPTLAGRWETARVACQLPALRWPELPAGLTLSVELSCTKRGARGPEGPTFGEAALEEEHAEGDVVARCGEETRKVALAAKGLMVPLPAGGIDRQLVAALESEVSKVSEQLVPWCHSQRGAGPECRALAERSFDEASQVLTERALHEGRWLPCFATAFERKVGVPLPRLRGP